MKHVMNTVEEGFLKFVVRAHSRLQTKLADTIRLEMEKNGKYYVLYYNIMLIKEVRLLIKQLICKLFTFRTVK